MAGTVPDWLSVLGKDMEWIAERAARAHWPDLSTDSGPYHKHRLEPGAQVECDAVRLLHGVGGDRDIVLAWVWIHDCFQPQLTGHEHAALAAEWGQEHLSHLGFLEVKVGQGSFTLANHSTEPRIISRGAKVARLMWDGDRLTWIAAASAVIVLCLSPALPNRPATHAGVAEIGLARLEEARAAIDMSCCRASRTPGEARLSAQERVYQAAAREVMYQQRARDSSPFDQAGGMAR